MSARAGTTTSTAWSTSRPVPTRRSATSSATTTRRWRSTTCAVLSVAGADCPSYTVLRDTCGARVTTVTEVPGDRSARLHRRPPHQPERPGDRRAAAPHHRRPLPPRRAADRGPAGGRLRRLAQPGPRGAAVGHGRGLHRGPAATRRGRGHPRRAGHARHVPGPVADRAAGRPRRRRARHRRRPRRAARPARPGPARHRAGRLRPGRRAQHRAPPGRGRDVRQPLAGAVLHRDVPLRALGVPARRADAAPRTRGRSTCGWSRRSRPTTRMPPSRRRPSTCTPPRRRPSTSTPVRLSR